MKPAAVTAVLVVTLVVCWSSGFVGATWGTGTAPVLTVLAWRTALCAVALGALVLSRGERMPAGAWPGQVVGGLLVQVVYLGGVFGAAGAGVPAGTTALIAAMQPLVVAALARPLLGAGVTRIQVAGLVVGAAGVAVVVAGDVGVTAWWAFLLPALAVAGLASGTLLEARGATRPPLLVSLAAQTAVAAVVFAALAALHGDLAPPADVRFWGAVGWLVTLSSFGGYGSYLLLVRRNGPTVTSALLYLTPPVTALWAWAMFGQRPGSLVIPGVVLTALGVALFARASRASKTVPVSGGRAPVPRIRPRSTAAPASRRRSHASRTTPRPASRR